MSAEAFRVDLRGIVDILSHHLYSSPRVYLRELVQNARDAVVARQELDGREPGPIHVETDPATGSVTVTDRGIGLTAEEMREVLATIGASSKTGDLGRARRRFLGQFGIGLLSCFLVADRIEVRSRSARTPDAPTLTWLGSADGTFTVSPSDEPLPEAGTHVTVTARIDDGEWVDPARVALLVRRFAGLLDVPVTFRGGPTLPVETITAAAPPWRGTPAQAQDWCARELGFTPLAAMTVEIPAAGVVGLAFLADTPGRVGNRRGDTVYSRGMFVAGDNVQLMPDWAYFVRLVVEAGDLPLTASRESLQDGALLEEVREQIGGQVRDGIERLAERDPLAFGRFLDVHATGLLAMAVTDPGMLDLVVHHLPWETSEGRMTLPRAVRSRDRVRYLTRRSDVATFTPVLRAAGELAIDGSYVYGAEILELVRSGRGVGSRIRPFDREEWLAGLRRPDPADALVGALRRSVTPVLDRLGVEADLREVDPASVPVLLVGAARGGGFEVGFGGDDGDGAGEAGGGGTDADGGADADPWAELLDGIVPTPEPARPRLVLNVANPAVQALVGLADPRVREDAVVGLYVIGLLMAGEKVDERHASMLSGTLTSLILAAGPTPDR